ncbi:NWD2 [Coprinopsis cinerea okayama7|uniref:NWD2 n=1 Tax=Coprinopsis cinerea (strain Okayama-7 / 130 / ATCC MYA-4618 / FGSC 9003) TaxID=240176 RepID=A8NIA1_COPC7|nr:NWD2 [Coprinopsis cinerea okayama7\|eukprot:XP_001833947.2 NWD2 [Coprinopsis cinerea okayama7\
MFNQSTNFSIDNRHGGKLINVSGDYIHYEGVPNSSSTCSHSPDHGISVLRNHILASAMHDADDEADNYVPGCHKGTRTKVQNDLLTWIYDSGEPQAVDLEDVQSPPPSSSTSTRIAWLKGPAGSGKSAIMRSLAETCDAEGGLAASFFFSYRSGERSTTKGFIATLAYQIAQKIPDARRFISAAIARDEAVCSKRLGKQLELLVVQPVQEAWASRSPYDTSQWPKVIFIDGLDECLKEGHKLEILRSLHSAIAIHQLPFSIVISSRPDQPMRDHFAEIAAREFVLDERYKPSLDIELFFRAELERIRRKYKIEDVNWPAEESIRRLVVNASGQFIYATTVLKFIDDPNEYDPQGQLKIVLLAKARPLSSTAAPRGYRNPLAHLDALYSAILHRCPNPRLSALAIRLLNSISQFREEYTRGKTGINIILPSLMGEVANRFLQYKASDVEMLFGGLHSLVHVPQRGTADLYYFHHKSLLDFLEDRERCGPDLFVSEDTVMVKAALHCQRWASARHHQVSIDKVPPGWVFPYARRIISTAVVGKDSNLDWWLDYLFSKDALKLSTVPVQEAL